MLSTQAKLSAGCGARVAPFGSSFCGARRFAKAAGVRSCAKWTMKGSFLVEVEVGELEAEDVAIQRFQRAVTNTLVLNELRRRRRVMTKIEAIQAKQNEKGLIKKLNVDPPTWKEHYGESLEAAPFADFFAVDNVDYADIANNTDITDEMFFDTIDPSGSTGFGSGNMYNSAPAYAPGGQYGDIYSQGQYGGQYAGFNEGFNQSQYSAGQYGAAQYDQGSYYTQQQP